MLNDKYKYQASGFDVDRHPRRSGSRMQSYLVNALCKTTGANSKRTDFALAA
jgi:hypothetical protein